MENPHVRLSSHVHSLPSSPSSPPLPSSLLTQEERQSLLLERIIKNVDLLNDALLELDRSVAEINSHNADVTIAAQMWANYGRNTAFNLQSMDENEGAERTAAGAAQGQGQRQA